MGSQRLAHDLTTEQQQISLISYNITLLGYLSTCRRYLLLTGLFYNHIRTWCKNSETKSSCFQLYLACTTSGTNRSLGTDTAPNYFAKVLCKILPNACGTTLELFSFCTQFLGYHPLFSRITNIASLKVI